MSSSAIAAKTVKVPAASRITPPISGPVPKPSTCETANAPA